MDTTNTIYIKFNKDEKNNLIFNNENGIISFSSYNMKNFYNNLNINGYKQYFSIPQNDDIQNKTIDYFLAIKETDDKQNHEPEFLFIDAKKNHEFVQYNVRKYEFKPVFFNNLNNSFVISIIYIENDSTVKGITLNYNNFNIIMLLDIFSLYLMYALNTRKTLNFNKIFGGKKQEKQTIERKVSYDIVTNKYYINYDSKKCYLTKHNTRVNKKKLFMTINGVEIMIKLK